MIELLKSMGHDLVAWRHQIFSLAKITLQKETKGTFFGWLWLIFKPAIYIFCFWFAIYIGLRGGKGMGYVEYLVWLTAGVVPWFMLKDAIGAGTRIFSKYKFLVCKMQFPVPLIPVFYELAGLLKHLLLLAVLLVVYVIVGGTFDIYFLQLPLIIVVMYLFCVGWSLLTSSISAFSKDFANLLGTLHTPLFWLSGVIFNITNITSPALQWLLRLNPITFVVQSYRQVFSNGSVISGEASGWIWNDPLFFWVGMGVVALTIIVGLFVFSRLRKDIPDVL